MLDSSSIVVSTSPWSRQIQLSSASAPVVPIALYLSTPRANLLSGEEVVPRISVASSALSRLLARPCQAEVVLLQC